MSQTEQLEKTSTPAYKWCPHCKEWILRDGFPKNRTKHDGLAGWCKLCKSECDKAYGQTPEGILGRFRKEAKHRFTEKRRLSKERFYARHGGQVAYSGERYHRIQDEAGCHMQIGDFYPAYRILKALQNAEVVNV